MAEASEAEGPMGTSISQATEPQTPAMPGDEAGAHSGSPAPVSSESSAVSASVSDIRATEGSPPETAGDPAGQGDGESGTAESTDSAEGANADGPGAKRKRRRKRKRKGEGDATVEGGPEGEAPAGAGAESGGPGHGGEARGKKRESSNAPFARFFASGQAGRKHGFAVGEVVAGRVRAVTHGSIEVDLFGKAVAYADEFEPREVPPAREAPPAEAPHSQESSAAASESGTGAAPAEPATAADAPPPEATPAVAAPPSEVSTVGEATPEGEGAPEALEASPAVAAEAEAHAPEVPHDFDEAHDHDHESETTLTGEMSPAGHGPLPPAPVVPDEYPRVEPPALGQVFRGRVGWVSESGHIALVNRDVLRKAVLGHLERYRTERRRVQGLVFGFNRGGFDVLVEGVRAFCPASAMTLDELGDPVALLGHKLEFLLPASQAVTKDIIVSRRSILERQLRKKAKELVRSLTPGQRLKGRVTQVRDFGVFVDIGGVDGLVHQSELSYAHGVKPSDVCTAGDEVEVKVLRVGGEPGRAEGGGRKDRLPRISLSIKALLPDPWDAHGDALAEGAVRRGKVTRTTDFGAFVELAPQIEGLLHISELGRDLKHANQAVSEGDEVCVVVERADKGTRRITLSKLSEQEAAEYEAAQASGAEAPRNVRVGSRIKVIVARVESRGVVVRVVGAIGKRARGYVPGSEIGERSGDLRKAFPLGAEIEVKVVGIDRDGSLRCSPKALAVDDERKAVKDYRREAAKQGFGTFGDLLRAKLGQPETK